MHKDYHPATSEAIPLSDNRLPAVGRRPVHAHYCSTSGDWDGQLPNADIAALTQGPPDDQVSNWPTLTKRVEWERSIVRIHGLSPPQAAALKEVAYRDGRGQGCTATMNTIAQDTGYNEKSMRRAIKELERAKNNNRPSQCRDAQNPSPARQKWTTNLSCPGLSVRGPFPRTASNLGQKVRGRGQPRSGSPGCPGKTVRGCFPQTARNLGHRVRGWAQPQSERPKYSGQRVRDNRKRTEYRDRRE